MAKVALLTLHGMGVTKVGYADEMLKALQGKLKAGFADLAIQKVYYQKPLQDCEEEVWTRIDNSAKVHYDDLRKFLLFGFADAAGLEDGKELDGSAYEGAQIEIAQKMLSARNALGGNGPMVVVSHSLGCQVFSCYLYDAQTHNSKTPGIWADIDRFGHRIAGRALTPDEKAFLAGATIRRWVTTGCNIPLFVAAHKEVDIKPIARPPSAGDFKWLNLYDPDDVLGWPLQPLSDEYRQLVEDRPMNAGRGAIDWILKSWNPLSHTAYWSDNDVLEPVEAMLREFL